MKTLLKNLRYLWKHEINQPLKVSIEPKQDRISDFWERNRNMLAPDVVTAYPQHKDTQFVMDWNRAQEALIKAGAIVKGAPTTEQVLQMNVHDFFKTDRVSQLTANARKLMRHHEIERVAELVEWSASQLKAYGVGWKSIDYIRYMLGKHGLKLKGDL